MNLQRGIGKSEYLLILVLWVFPVLWILLQFSWFYWFTGFCWFRGFYWFSGLFYWFSTFYLFSEFSGFLDFIVSLGFITPWPACAAADLIQILYFVLLLAYLARLKYHHLNFFPGSDEIPCLQFAPLHSGLLVITFWILSPSCRNWPTDPGRPKMGRLRAGSTLIHVIYYVDLAQTFAERQAAQVQSWSAIDLKQSVGEAEYIHGNNGGLALVFVVFILNVPPCFQAAVPILPYLQLPQVQSSNVAYATQSPQQNESQPTQTALHYQ